MKLILLGAPGAGKGTQAELLSAKLSIPAISTGNMLREAIANGTDLGKQVKQFMDEGSLVPDALIMSIIAERVACADCQNRLHFLHNQHIIKPLVTRFTPADILQITCLS